MKETFEFNHKKQCGLWLILVAIVLTAAVIFGGEFLVNPFVFLIGYYVSFFCVNVNKKVREKLSNGEQEFDNVEDAMEEIEENFEQKDNSDSDMQEGKNQITEE